jgi:crotonobetainyl-CoA:carnitine CoA-transferase CaiB-like acyl-CoA transferase
MLPLDGVRILDLSRLLPGPYCTLLLADLGADVTKVEDPQGGDYIRHMPPSAGESSALFHALNRNKRSLALDLKSPQGKEAFRALARRADAVVESFRPGVMDRLGLGYEALAAENPRLIVCSISGYGATGPLRHRAGHDLNYVARSGVLGYGGTSGGPPAMPGVQIADIGGGSLMAAVGILAALNERTRTGRGRHLDISMSEGSLAFLHMHLGGRMAGGASLGPLSRGVEALNGGYPCYGVYRTKEGRYLAVAPLEPKFWGAFCAAVGREDLSSQGWATEAEGASVREEVAAIVAARTLPEWEVFLSDKDLCCEPVREGDEVLEDPQFVARGLTFTIDDPREKRPIAQLRTPLHMGEVPRRPAPGLGEHTDEVLTEAGLSSEQIAALRSAGVVA